MFNWRKKALKVFNKEKSEKETEYDFAEEIMNVYNKMNSQWRTQRPEQ